MFEKSEISIPCSNCGCQTTKTVGWLKNHSAFECRCGTRINVDASQFNREMSKIDVAMNELQRAFKRFGK